MVQVLHFGSLVFEYQTMDVAGPFDFLNLATRSIAEYGLKHGAAVSKEVIGKAPNFVFHHIAETLDPVQLMTSGFKITPTDTLDDCPEVDYLLIGGPLPENFEFPPKYVDFIKRHHAAGKTIFTTCTGASALASTGILDGKNATVNNVEYNYIVKRYPKVKWSKDKKWVVDGNIWTGGGVLAGMDMFAHWIETTYGKDVMIAAAMQFDYEPRDINGITGVIPLRYDATGKQISTTVFPN
ncbi:class I glutamine amidotransferase-like protein [Periconia macrospinosa]|uniref:Class I glutamine amidotransferase-like protein n=1 Tax=Periconia macrospinosa TaxID=97972 RepID=A0A2V1DEF3_9PLEO|nr:class I glutamine amidotransferase-like protein [Periconia macrospinosa]